MYKDWNIDVLLNNLNSALSIRTLLRFVISEA